MLRVRLGAHYLSDSGQTSEHRVDRIIRHIDFKQTTLVSKDAETERVRFEEKTRNVAKLITIYHF